MPRRRPHAIECWRCHQRGLRLSSGTVPAPVHAPQQAAVGVPARAQRVRNTVQPRLAGTCACRALPALCTSPLLCKALQLGRRAAQALPGGAPRPLRALERAPPVRRKATRGRAAAGGAAPHWPPLHTPRCPWRRGGRVYTRPQHARRTSVAAASLKRPRSRVRQRRPRPAGRTPSRPPQLQPPPAAGPPPSVDLEHLLQLDDLSVGAASAEKGACEP